MQVEDKLKQQEALGINPLEKLYTLEKVDPKTIRTYVPLNAPQEKVLRSSTLEPCREIGGGYPILSLFDSMERLKLPPPLQYQLKKMGWKTVLELVEADNDRHPKILALPKAHQDILQRALKPWNELILCGKVTKLDFKGYFRGLGLTLDPLAYLTLLSEVGLLHYVEATPYECVQIERLAQVEKERLVTIALGGMSLGKEVEAIFEGLLFGWIEPRGGVTTRKELVELLEQDSVDKGAANGFLNLLEKKGRACWFIKDGLWFFHRPLKKRLDEISFFLNHFFYREKLSYGFCQLEEWIQRELLATGEWLDPVLLKRYLLLSDRYRLERGDLITYTVHL